MLLKFVFRHRGILRWLLPIYKPFGKHLLELSLVVSREAINLGKKLVELCGLHSGIVPRGKPLEQVLAVVTAIAGPGCIPLLTRRRSREALLAARLHGLLDQRHWERCGGKPRHHERRPDGHV